MSDGVLAALVTAAGGVVVAIITLLSRRSGAGADSPPPAKMAKEAAPTDVPKSHALQTMELSGRWHGEQESAGWIYDGTLHLQVAKSQVKGHIKWVLVQCPPKSPLAKRIGAAGVEYVNGSIEGNSISLNGYQVDDPKLLTLGDYSITLHQGLNSFEATTRNKQGKHEGSLHGRVSIA